MENKATSPPATLQQDNQSDAVHHCVLLITERERDHSSHHLAEHCTVRISLEGRSYNRPTRQADVAPLPLMVEFIHSIQRIW